MSAPSPGPETAAGRDVRLLTRAGCPLCDAAERHLGALARELGFTVARVDVDAAAAAGDPGPRADYGDLLPVVLLDGTLHSYWEVDEQRLRADLSRGS